MLADGPYNPQSTEARILKWWHEQKLFKPEYNPKTDKVMTKEEMQADKREPFCIICPPPNAYARAHVGNLSGYSYQDVFARFARMNGKKVLMIPGKDHAAQEAEVIYLRDVLGPKGKRKEDFSREEFYNQCYQYFTDLAKTIQQDEKMIGLSADFDRDIFTLDPRIAETIYSTFMQMFNDGMVYKDVRIVNWSPGMKSVIPDIETDRLEREADLTYIKYPVGEVDKDAIEIRDKLASKTIKWTFERSETKDGAHTLPFSFGEYLGYSINQVPAKVIAIGYSNLQSGEKVDGEVIGVQMNLSAPCRLVVKKPGSEVELGAEFVKIFNFESKYYAGAHIILFDEAQSDESYRNGIFVATTRPETMLGDTAIVVDPRDERYADLIGRYVYLPLTDRQIPIIANGRVDKEFGTGAVKLTPAHSADDYTMMLEWNYQKDFAQMPQHVVAARDKVGEVSYINVISRDSKMVGPSGKYVGMDIATARAAIVADLADKGLIDHSEKITQNVLICDRTKTVIEPIMSSQWFVDVDRLKQPAIDAIKKGEVVIHPESMQSKMLHWLENLRDWPISRSIWWGYRFPVWYKGEFTEEVNARGKVVIKIDGEEISDMQDAVNKGLIKVQLDCPAAGWVQDPDVFDTWFSSGQWPFATLKAFDLMQDFYPTNVMEMAYGILELWASRMIMLGLYTQGKVPFRDVYIQGHIKAADGRKMSKSLKNNVNIDELNEKYGIDAVRLFYIVGNKAGADYRIDYEKLEGFRRFLNKIWNASKFVLMNTQGVSLAEPVELKISTNQELLSHLANLHTNVTKLIEGFNIGVAAQELFESFWHYFCDIALEQSKPNLYIKKDKQTGEVISEPDPTAKLETQQVLLYALKKYIQMLHPFIPFVTEEIWQSLPAGEHKSVLYSSW